MPTSERQRTGQVGRLLAHGTLTFGVAEIDARLRDYFQVEDDTGERFWLFRAGDGEDPDTGKQGWFIHGIFA